MKISKSMIVIVVSVLALLGAFLVLNQGTAPKEINYSDFYRLVQADKLNNVVVSENKIVADLGTAMPREKNSSLFGLPQAPISQVSTVNVKDAELIALLKSKGLSFKGEAPPEPSIIGNLFWAIIPLLFVFGLFWLLDKKMKSGSGNGGGSPFTFGQSKAKIEIKKDDHPVRLEDIAGCDEAKQEVAEIVDFLKNPEKYRRTGSRPPKGILMVGPPGTGKTMLARAIASEADVAFASISGSEFVEMFVGVGASRVRDLFQKAKKAGRCIIFIDEIDAMGRSRGSGTGGGNDEREQTLNQMLVEMDGFDPNGEILVIAATNRPDVLDKALLRPGRFDRQVTVGLPNVQGREEILKVHMRKIPVGQSIDIKSIARSVPGFAGADLANLVNEAALMAARESALSVEQKHFILARDKIIMGPEKKSIMMSENERSDTAYHESGHALTAHLIGADKVEKVSIVPRGGALGVTIQMPEEEKYSLGKQDLIKRIQVLLGGRVAEELFGRDITTGASNDYERATKIARSMVTKWGMSSLGHMVIGATGGNPFMYASEGEHLGASESTNKKVDQLVIDLLNEQYDFVKNLLSKNTAAMHAMRNMLMDKETIDHTDVVEIVKSNPQSVDVVDVAI